MSKQWRGESAEKRFVVGPEDNELRSFAFCSDPESFIVEKMKEYPDQEDIPGKIGHAVKEVSAAIDTLLGIGNIVSAHPEVSIILTSGPDTLEGELALYRIVKNSGIIFDDMKTWLDSLPSYEKSPEGKLFERGTLLRLKQVYSE